MIFYLYMRTAYCELHCISPLLVHFISINLGCGTSSPALILGRVQGLNYL